MSEKNEEKTNEEKTNEDCEICFAGSCDVSCQKCHKSFCQKCLVNFLESGEHQLKTMKCVYCLQIIPFRQLCDIFGSEKSASTYFYTKEHIDRMVVNDQVPLAKTHKILQYDRYRHHFKETTINLKEQVSLNNSMNYRCYDRPHVMKKEDFLESDEDEEDDDYDDDDDEDDKKRKKSSQLLLTHQTKKQKKSRSKQQLQIVDMICPGTTCSGLISVQKGDEKCCNICQISICGLCNEQKLDPEQHTCNPDILKNKEFLKNHLYPCPKCGVFIEKSRGCPSMYCTFCGHRFSYGRVTSEALSVVHENFHYVNQPRLHGQHQLDSIALLLSNREILSNRDVESLNSCRVHEFTSNKIHLAEILECVGLGHLVVLSLKKQKTVFHHEWVDKIHLLFHYDLITDWKATDQLFQGFFRHRNVDEKIQFLKILHFLYELPDCLRNLRNQKYTGETFDDIFESKKTQFRKQYLMQKICKDTYGKGLLKCQFEEQKELIYGTLLDLLLLNLHIIQEELYKNLKNSGSSSSSSSSSPPPPSSSSFSSVLQRIQNLLVIFNDMFHNNFLLHSVNIKETPWKLKTTNDTYETGFFL